MRAMKRMLLPAMAALLAINAPDTARGEVFLKGNYVEVGIHNAGSFGTQASPPAGFHSYGQLGFIADPGKDGWSTGVPPKTGDYFVPGTPEEGWMLSWASGGTRVSMHNFGLMWETDVPMTSLTDTSSGTERSAVWEGTATNGNDKLKVTQTVSFNENDLFFVINVALTNTGSTTIRSLEYMRNVDPDQEMMLGKSFTTSNWVEFQPGRTGVPGRPDLAPRPAGNTSKALAIAEGLYYHLTLGLGTYDSRATVTASQGFSNRNSSVILNSPSQPTASAPRVADEAIALAYDLGDLAPGQSTTITYAYILNKSDLDPAMASLAAVTLLQPVGTVSGANVLFQAKTDKVASTAKIDFYVNDEPVGTDLAADEGGVFEATFDSRRFPNGTVALKALATFSDGRTSGKTSTVTVDNTGPAIAFTTPTPSMEFYGEEIPIQIAVLDAEQPPVRMSFFRETAASGSLFLGEDTTAPFSTAFGVTDLTQGETVVIKAVAYDALNRTTSITVSGVTRTNRLPVADAGADMAVEAAGAVTPVSLTGLGSSDLDGDVLSYTWTGPTGTTTGATPVLNLPVGAHTINLSVDDGKGGVATDAVLVTVKDTTPPVLKGLAAQTLEATGPNGAAAAFDVTAADLVDPTPLVTCDRGTGTVFPLGATTVTCTALDSFGNRASGSFNVKVQDTKPPVLTVPANLTLLLNTPATSPVVAAFLSGAVAKDIVDQDVAIATTAPADYATVGGRTVTFTATDDAGNVATATATIYVQYGFGGFLAPVSLGKPFKLGSTVPIKFQLTDQANSLVTSANARLQMQRYNSSEPVGEPVEVVSTNSDFGTSFRYSDNEYIYNLSTKALTAGTWQIRAILDDGTVKTEWLALK